MFSYIYRVVQCCTSMGSMTSALCDKFITDVTQHMALSRISPRVRVRDSDSIVYRIAPGGYIPGYGPTHNVI